MSKWILSNRFYEPDMTRKVSTSHLTSNYSIFHQLVPCNLWKVNTGAGLVYEPSRMAVACLPSIFDCVYNPAPLRSDIVQLVGWSGIYWSARSQECADRWLLLLLAARCHNSWEGSEFRKHLWTVLALVPPVFRHGVHSVDTARLKVSPFFPLGLCLSLFWSHF